MIQSHNNPQKTLLQHIQEVERAGVAILERHSKPVQEQIKKWLYWAIKFHDVGKATTEFQTYIQNPDIYPSKKKMLKAHTPMSLYWWLSFTFSKRFDFETILAVSVAVWKHHSDFPEYESQNGFKFCLSQYYDDILKPQLVSFEIEKLERIIDIPFGGIQPTDHAAAFLYFNQNSLPTETKKAVNLRLRIQLLFSMLLEADKIELALAQPFLELYYKSISANLPTNLVAQYFSKYKTTTFNTFRTNLRKQITQNPLYPISLISLPTGMGKTMVAAEWMLKHRILEDNKYRKVIIVLPFLSIIDQTVKEYQKLLGQIGASHLILESHSLSSRYDAKNDFKQDMSDADEEEKLEQEFSKDFLAKIWNKPIIITTFDQFLYATLSEKGRHLIRFHNVADALVIMDEIQALPTKLWTIFSNVAQELSQSFNTRFLIMSATQPHFMPKATELVENPETVFQKQNRYQFSFRHKHALHIDIFIEECIGKLKSIWKGKRVLIVLNTRPCAKKVFIHLKASVKITESSIFFISGDVTPRDRLEQIEEIKKGDPCIVIATQCIEAGVDIDMEFVVRDFAPLDALIQVAGRGNRNNTQEKLCIIEIVKLTNGSQYYCNMIYTQDEGLFLNVTDQILANLEELTENSIYPVVQNYFQILSKYTDTGKSIASQWEQWKQIDIKKLLRGDSEKFEFIVIKQDPLLENELDKVLKIKDRWERKLKLRNLSERISKITISVWTKKGFIPQKIARPHIGGWWLLYDDYYTDREGISGTTDNIEAIII